MLLSQLTTELALVTLFSSQRDAEAVNLAGSLRMQNYRMAWDASRQPQHLAQHLALFQQTLDAPVLRKLDRPWVPRKVKVRYQQRLQQGDTVAYQQQVPGLCRRSCWGCSVMLR